MIDHLRRHATICRSAMARRRELTVVRARLETRLGRGASDAEMADEMDLQAADYRQLVDETQAVRHESLDEAYSDKSIWSSDVEARAHAKIGNAPSMGKVGQ